MVWWYGLHGALLIALAWLVWKRQSSGLRNLFWWAWLFKIITTLVVVVVHRHHYPDSDMLSFYNWAAESAKNAANDFSHFIGFLFKPSEGYYTGEARSEFFVKILSLFAFANQNDMVLMSLWLSMFPFFTAWRVVHVLVKREPQLKRAAIIAFLFYPSAVFWTSGILKETLAMAGIFFIISVFLRLWYGQRPGLWEYMLLMPSIWIAWKLKYYYVALLFPVMMASFITRYTGKHLLNLTTLREVLFYKAVFLMLILIPGLFHPNLRPGKLMQVVAESHNQFVQQAGIRHLSDTDLVEPSAAGILSHMLPALVQGLFAPWQPDFSDVFYMLSVVENWLLILLSLIALSGLAIPVHAGQRILLWATLIYCVSMALWLGLAVPAAGTLVRYKAGFLSCYLMLILPVAINQLNRLRPVLMK